MIAYKIDVLAALKDRGFSTYRIRKDKIFSESTLQAFRSGDTVSYPVIEKLCQLLGCDVGDVLHYVPDADDSAQQNG